MHFLRTGIFRFFQRLLPDFNVSYSVHLKPYVRIITISAISLAFGFGIALRNFLVFEFHDNSGVVGWISINAYPKQQEYFYYLLALLGVPASIWIFWFVWLTYSQWAAQFTHQSIHRVLKLNALASIPLWLSWRQIFNYDHASFFGLTLPIGLTLLFKLFLLFSKFQLIKGKDETASSDPIILQSGKIFELPKHLTLLLRGCEYVLIPILIYLLMYNGNINGGIDMFHEGERLAPLNEMLHGGVVYRDIYVQHGLFQNAYLAWFGSKIFEPTLMGVRSMERVLAPLGYIALYLLGLQVFRGRFLSAFICFLIASGDNFSVSPRHSLGLISFAFVANYLIYNKEKGLFVSWNRIPFDERNLLLYLFRYGWKLVLAGFFTSLAFWYSTEIGLYTLGAIGLFLVIYSLQRRIQSHLRPLPLGGYCFGLLLGFLPVAIYFLSHGALDDAFWNSYIQCKYQLATWGLKFPSLSVTLGILSEEGWEAFFLSNGLRWYLPIIVYVLTAAYLSYRRLCRSRLSPDAALKLMLLLLGGIAFFRTALGRSDGGHLNFGATFLWLLCLIPIDMGISRMVSTLFSAETDESLRTRLSHLTDRTRWLQVLKAAWILIPIAMFVWYVGEVHRPISKYSERLLQLQYNPFERSLADVELEGAGQVDIPDDQVEQIQKVVTYIRENTDPDEKIFDFTSQGAYFFFAKRPSVTRYFMVSYASTPEMQHEVIEALEKDQTRLVIIKTGGWFDRVDGIPVEERHPLITSYLEENYKLAININNTEILLRIDGEN